MVFASFVFPHLWARIQGVDYDIVYDRWKESEFFKFVHLKQIDERAEQGMNRRLFAPGPFKDDISLIVDSNEGGKIMKASLLLNKDWMARNILLALDISKSFVTSFAPPPDKEEYGEISRALWNLRNPQFAMTVKETDPKESIVLGCVHAFMGSIGSASMTTDFGNLSFKNVTYEKEHIQEVEFILM